MQIVLLTAYTVMKSCTFCQFREHEWFKIDLADYLFPTASDVDASVVDTDAIREVCEVSGIFMRRTFTVHDI